MGRKRIAQTDSTTTRGRALAPGSQKVQCEMTPAVRKAMPIPSAANRVQVHGQRPSQPLPQGPAQSRPAGHGPLALARLGFSSPLGQTPRGLSPVLSSGLMGVSAASSVCAILSD